MLTKAIVREPSATFASGLTTANLGVADYKLALQQHQAYCEALESCGVTVIRLEPDETHPDSTFVEDTAVLTLDCAVITHPGAATRRGETESIATVLREHFDQIHSIEEPGTLDGGDVLETDDHFFIGISERTNESGAKQLAGLLARYDQTSTLIDIRRLSNILHLKSGLAYLNDNRLVVIEALRGLKEFAGYDLVCLSSTEEYAANCIGVNMRVLIADGFPMMRRELEDKGYHTIALDMSEFQKMDGGLSCLSLRF